MPTDLHAVRLAIAIDVVKTQEGDVGLGALRASALAPVRLNEFVPGAFTDFGLRLSDLRTNDLRVVVVAPLAVTRSAETFREVRKVRMTGRPHSVGPLLVVARTTQSLCPMLLVGVAIRVPLREVRRLSVVR
jgi:hypothetical protein